MPQLLRKAWSDPVWSKVIASAILAIAGSLLAYGFGWWPRILDAALQRHAVPTWLLILLALAAVPTSTAVGAALWFAVFPRPATGPTWAGYTTDELLGVRWRWRYSQSGTLFDLTSFCPSCDFQIFAEPGGLYRAVPRTAFRCESCGRHIAEFDGSTADLESKVTRIIQQKLRAGTWPDAPRTRLLSSGGSG